METIVVSTHNKGKVKEMEGIVKKLGFDIVTRDEYGIPKDLEIEEDGKTLEENSYKKAYEIMKLCGKPTLADDSGLMVDYLGGEPGVYSSRYGGEDGNAVLNNTKLLQNLQGVPFEKRTAHFETVITLVYPDGDKIVCKGCCYGHITEEPIGDQGFGYDPVFMPDGYDKTFAQLGVDVKNKFSHRAIALVELEKKLKEKHSL